MDYLDEKLRRKKKVEVDDRIDTTGYEKKIIIGMFGIHFGWVLGNLFRNRHDVVGKTRISKVFYKTWFPIYLLVWVVHPIDKFCWEKVDGQIGFWQRIVFDDQVDENVKKSG